MSHMMVLRHGPEVPAVLRVEDWEGRWIEYPGTAPIGYPGDSAQFPVQLVAYNTGRWETREDGVCGRVWEMRLPE